MVCCFRDLCREGLGNGGWGLAAQWVRAVPELLSTALQERSSALARNSYRAAVGVALAAACILVWMNLAVGVIGTEDYGTNLSYLGFPCYLVAKGLAFWRSVVTHIIYGTFVVEGVDHRGAAAPH